MAGNSTGYIFRLTTFGESHGVAVGGVIDGCPEGLFIDEAFIRQELGRRSPRYKGSTTRMEPDQIEFISGIREGKSTGSPISFVVKNTESRSGDYDSLANVYRPSHADFTYARKYGSNSILGGGRASGRETVARVIAGAVAKLFLRDFGIEVRAMVSQIGEYQIDAMLTDENLLHAAHSVLGCPDSDSERVAEKLIGEAKASGDTIGGCVSCRISGSPAGLGEPVFDKLEADLARSMLSIGSAKAFEFGMGFESAGMRGSEYNDQMTAEDGRIVFLSNHDGGIQGGISNGQDIYFRVAFKPVPSINLEQSTITADGQPIFVKIKGRHDTCHVPRLAVIVEAMAALVMADHFLRFRGYRPG